MFLWYIVACYLRSINDRMAVVRLVGEIYHYLTIVSRDSLSISKCSVSAPSFLHPYFIYRDCPTFAWGQSQP